MAIKEMTPAECHAFMKRAQMGRLGCALDDQPYVVPIRIACEQDYVYSFSTLGQKIEWMRANPKVCLQLDELTSSTRWTSVIVTGLYQELAVPQFETERAHARKLLASEQHWWLNPLAERDLKSDSELIGPLFFRIHIDSLSGLQASDAESTA